jgi:RNA polymerase sigma-70 factor (ECF subfamily)
VELVTCYRERIFYFVLKLIKNQSDAEEVTQDTFIRAHRGLKDFRGDSAFSTWLFTIARNLSLNRYWYWHRRQRHMSVSIDAPISEENESTLADVVPADGQGAAHELTVAEFSRLVDESTEKLGFSHRTILALRNQQELSYEEIADVLCVSVGTVKSRIARARESLRAYIAENYPDLAHPDEIVKLLVSRVGSGGNNSIRRL